MVVIALCIVTSAVLLRMVFPPRTQEMLREWETENRLEILKAIRLNHPWSMTKWGVFSQSQRFVRVLVRDVDTDARNEMVLRLGGLLFGLAVKRVRICETRPLDMAPPEPQG